MEIKVGSKVKYRGCFGMFEPKEVSVKYIERSEYKRCKYGVFVLDDGHWCYGEQIVGFVS